VTKKYPLEPLRRVRVGRVDDAKRALFEANKKLEEARGDLARREREKAELEEAAQRTRAHEEDLLAKGDLSAVDLMRGAAWGVLAELRHKEKTQKAEQARRVVAKASDVVADRRGEAQKAEAEREVVERNHERWERAAQTAAMDAEEQTAEEAHLSRAHHRSKQ
jgi:hypothetical protein